MISIKNSKGSETHPVSQIYIPASSIVQKVIYWEMSVTKNKIIDLKRL